jgi:hypothetical protein
MAMHLAINSPASGLRLRSTGLVFTTAFGRTLDNGCGGMSAKSKSNSEDIELEPDAWELVKYKFKDWRSTEKRKEKVTLQMKRERAREIAEKLNKPTLWNSHGLGISMERLRKELNLKIDDFGENRELSDAIRSYHKLLTDYMGSNRHRAVIHTRDAYEPLMRG